jgi:hypothetical protein
MERTGKVFADRFHHRVLASPRQVRAALAYVLCNARKHGVAARERGWLDPRSSAAWFDGWTWSATTSDGTREKRTGELPVSAARTWLLGGGWRRAGGPIDPDHCPGSIPI